MLLSIIIPSFNQGRFIQRTLDSIFEQDYRPIEVIVADGASTDETLDILRRCAQKHPELRWISEPDKGPADAVNKGLTLATGEIAAIQSSDDIYYPGAFSAVARTFQRSAECGFIIGHYRGIDVDDRVIYTERMPEFSWEAYAGLAFCIPQSSIFFRMSVAREAGGWNGKYYACDIDYWLRILLRTRAIRLDQVLSGWRVYPGARTHSGQYKRMWEGFWRMIDDCRELPRAEPRVRRLVHASKHVLAMRIYPTGNRWMICWHLLQATVLHPTWWRYQPAKRILACLPGFGIVRHLRRLACRSPSASLGS